MKKNKLILKNMSFVSAGIMISRILGYFRDMLVAKMFGAGFYGDAFYAAFRIPNLFRRLFGENSLNAAFVPVLSEYMLKDTKERTEEFLSVISTVMVGILSVLTILGVLFAVPLIKLITWGFPEEKIFLTAKLLQIMFPYMIFICLAALGLSILNCLKIFFIPAISSSSLSIAEIIFILFVAVYLPEEKRIFGLALSVLVGGMLQLCINFAFVSKHYKITLNFKKFFYYLTLPEVKRVYLLFLPVVVGFSTDQINALVDTLCASFLKEGSISALYYSNRLMQLPLALFAISLTTVVLPQMSQEVATLDYDELKETVIHSLRNILFFILPASIGLVILGKDIIKTLFEYGKFTKTATLMTYSCLAFYSLGLLFFSVSKVFTIAFYALKKPDYPVKVSMKMVVLNAILNVILMQFLEVGGLALATSLASFVATILLYVELKKIININFSSIKSLLFKTFLANAVFILFLFIIKTIIQNSYIVTFLGVTSGVFVYFMTTKILKIEETQIITSFLRKFLQIYG
ncbi:MAG: murein biosynthesis integral membrane protein MurJ [Endomicrobiia bacterium]